MAVRRWHGRDVRAIDGSALRLLGTPDAIAMFGQMFPTHSSRDPGADFTELRSPISLFNHRDSSQTAAWWFKRTGVAAPKLRYSAGMSQPQEAEPLHIVVSRAAKVPLATQIHAALRDAIRDGRLAGGARLPSWRDLATQLGVSRGTVREAYERLTARFESHGGGRRFRFGWARRCSIMRMAARVTMASETSGSSS